MSSRRTCGLPPQQFAVAALLAACLAAPDGHAAPVPLPRARPAEAPALNLPGIPTPQPRPAVLPPLEAPAETPAETRAEPAEPSACVQELGDRAVFERAPPVTGANGCGIDDPVKLSAVLMPNGAKVAINPPALLRCAMASAIANWLREDMAVLPFGSPLAAVTNFSAYECRGRNRIIGAMLSEHGKGNALDVRAFTLANGKHVEPTDIAVAKDFRERMKASVCARFATVLGPASDGFHENHIHVDLAQRRSGFRMCQWAVRDASDLIPLPRERPAEAPPRDEPPEEDPPALRKGQ